jgi:YD repeat-containing protein
MSVKRAKLVILAVSTLAVPLLMAQVRSLEERTATMSDREQRGLRGSVKSCTEESTHPGMADADGKTYPEVHSEYTTEYDTDGRIRITRSRNSDGSQWVTRYGYDASGRLLKTASGAEGTSLGRSRRPNGASWSRSVEVRDYPYWFFIFARGY